MTNTKRTHGTENGITYHVRSDRESLYVSASIDKIDVVWTLADRHGASYVLTHCKGGRFAAKIDWS